MMRRRRYGGETEGLCSRAVMLCTGGRGAAVGAEGT